MKLIYSTDTEGNEWESESVYVQLINKDQTRVKCVLSEFCCECEVGKSAVSGVVGQTPNSLPPIKSGFISPTIPPYFPNLVDVLDVLYARALYLAHA